MNKRFIALLVTILGIITIIATSTIIIVKDKVLKKELNIIEIRVLEASKECLYKEICSKDKITLNELYENNLIEIIKDPRTKENINPDSYVDVNKNKLVIIK